MPIVDPSAIDFDDPLYPLADFEAQGGYELLDMIAIVPDRRLDSVRFQQFGSCTTVESLYGELDDGFPALAMTQSHGCRVPAGSVLSSFGSWIVAFSVGDPVKVEWLKLNGPALDPDEVSYDPDRALDAGLASSEEVHELGRFDWEGSRVSIQTGGEPFDPRASLLPVIEPTEQGGNQNFDCTEFSLLEYQRPNPTEAGFVVLVSDRSDIGLTFPIEMKPSLVEGLFIGFVDYAMGTYEWGFEPWNPIEPDGSLVTCTQE